VRHHAQLGRNAVRLADLPVREVAQLGADARIGGKVCLAISSSRPGHGRKGKFCARVHIPA
jgi:hypothetical protein